MLDSYLLGLVNQRAGRMDPTLTTEVTNHLFEKPGKLFGIDLAAINIQRGRDMGVPGYNHFRDYCGLPRAKYFDDLTGVFSNKTLLRLSQLYKHVDDIDLWTAGIAEYPIQDGLVGPTFACLIARQFVNLRRGDRFWYENDGYPPQFTIEQLDEIRKATAARLVCDNSDEIDTVQASAMLVADPYTNPRVPCSSLPYIEPGKWKEYAPAATHAHQPPAPPADYPHLSLGDSLDGEYAAATAALATADGSAHYLAAAGDAAAAANEALAGYESGLSKRRLKAAAAVGSGSGAHRASAHFVDHIVDAQSYRQESRAYQTALRALKN